MDQLGPDRGGPPPAGGSSPPPPDEPTVVRSPTADTVIGAPPDDATQAYPTFAPPVETSSAVPTQIVDTPPVKAFVAEPPAGPRRIGGRASALVAILGILAIGGVAAFGYTLTQDLSSTRATLASTETELGSTKSTLDTTGATLTETTTTLTTTKAERATLDAQVAELSAQVATQTKCVALQAAALDELTRISDLQTANNNRTSKDSTWARASDKRSKAVNNALDDYYQAAQKAADGNKSAAKALAAKGKVEQGVIATQAKQQAAEFGLIDRSADEIEAAINALEQQLKTTESTCKEVD